MTTVVNTPMTFRDTGGMLCKATGKWGLYLHVSESFFDLLGGHFPVHLSRATNGRWEFYRDTSAVVDGSAFLLFDTEAEMLDAYDDIVGDDGPTKRNSYSGPVRVYALTFGPHGDSMNENT